MGGLEGVGMRVGGGMYVCLREGGFSWCGWEGGGDWGVGVGGFGFY